MVCGRREDETSDHRVRLVQVRLEDRTRARLKCLDEVWVAEIPIEQAGSLEIALGPASGIRIVEGRALFGLGAH